LNILLVDDESESRLHVAEFLRELGHTVVEKDDGYEALQSVCTEEFNLVLSDIKMPRLSGLELLRHIRSLPGGQDLRVVLFTGYGDLRTSVEALRSGAHDYLLKPIDIEELCRLTEQVAKSQSTGPRQRTEDTAKNTDAAAGGDAPKRDESYTHTKMVFFSGAMREVIDQARKLHTDRSVPVLIEGETGTGKELVARYIHHGEDETDFPFVGINCAALSPTLFESELFGYEAGAYTGGLARGQKGKLDLAKGGTLFLDEITEIPVSLQAKLLRVIQEKEFYRVGGLQTVPTDVRIVCATNQDIEKCVAQGTFRADLYYRLNVARIHIPPLRQRPEDIIPLASIFLDEFSRKKGKQFATISEEAARILLSYPWPGNVRELRNVMARVALLWDDTQLRPCHLEMLEPERCRAGLPNTGNSSIIDYRNFTLPADGLPLEEYVNNIIRTALHMHNYNKAVTARYLGISRRSLYCRLKHLS